MDDRGHIEFHLKLDEVEIEGDRLRLSLQVSLAELGVLTAALSLLGQLADEEIISLALDEYGELGDPREPTRRLALERLFLRFYRPYTNQVLGPPLQS